VRVLLNPSAGSGRAPRALSSLMRTREDVDWVRTRSAEDLQQRVRAAELEGASALGLAGGDGTVALAAAALTGKNRVPWRVLPVGSGNDFAAQLGVTRASLEGSPRRVDLGRANGHRFCCVASLGLDTRALEIVHGSRWPRSRALNLWAALRALLSYQPRVVRVTWDGGSFEGPIMFVAVTNTASYAGGFRVSPAARLDDGLLDLCIVRNSGKARLLRQFPRIFQGTHGELPEVTLAQSRRVRLESDAPLPVALDGELPRLTTPVTIECEPAALTVLT